MNTPAYQTLEPRPQIGKSFEASVNVVPRKGFSDPPLTESWDAGTNRRGSNASGSGYLEGSCMKSQAGTHAISPVATLGPPLEKVYDFSAFRRIPTVESINHVFFMWSVPVFHLLLSNGLLLTASLMKLSSRGSWVSFWYSRVPACWSSR